MAVLPPGVSSADFEAACRQFAAAVGGDWVLVKAGERGWGEYRYLADTARKRAR